MMLLVWTCPPSLKDGKMRGRENTTKTTVLSTESGWVFASRNSQQFPLIQSSLSPPADLSWYHRELHSPTRDLGLTIQEPLPQSLLGDLDLDGEAPGSCGRLQHRTAQMADKHVRQKV